MYVCIYVCMYVCMSIPPSNSILGSLWKVIRESWCWGGLLLISVENIQTRLTRDKNMGNFHEGVIKFSTVDSRIKYFVARQQRTGNPMLPLRGSTEDFRSADSDPRLRNPDKTHCGLSVAALKSFVVLTATRSSEIQTEPTVVYPWQHWRVS